MPLDKVIALIDLYGRDTVSSQALEPGLSYWFSDDGEACVAYASVRGAWVAAGGPICARSRRQKTMQNFSECARSKGKRARFFATEEPCEGFFSAPIGLQPEWEPQRWAQTVASKRSLREQLRRACAKGVAVRELSAQQMCDPSAETNRQVRAMVRDWQESHAMAPMRFLVNLDLFGNPERKHYFVAERDGAVVALLLAVDIPAREGWFFENLMRAHNAPNGSTELLFDFAMRAALAAERKVVSFGLAPLAGDLSTWLAKVRKYSCWLYDFEGLRRYKAKLMPTRWQQVYLAFPDTESGARATVDSLTAFANGSWLGFGLRTLAHSHATLVWWFAMLLLPWTTLLSQGAVGTWYPSETIRAAWVTLDMLVFVGLVNLALEFRKSRATLLALVSGGDAILGLVQLLLYTQHSLHSPWQWGFAIFAIAAPLAAAILIGVSASLRERLYSLDR